MIIIDDRETYPKYGQNTPRYHVLNDDIRRIVTLSHLGMPEIAKETGIHPLVIHGVLALLGEKQTELAQAIIAPDQDGEHLATLDERLAAARLRVLNGEDFQSVLNDLTIASLEHITVAVSRPKSVHDAADAFTNKIKNAVQFGFARGRAAVDKPALRSAVSQAQALVALSAVEDAVKSALNDILPPILKQCFVSGGDSGVEIFNLRTAEFRAARPKSILKMRFDARTVRATQWAEKHAADLVKGIAQTTRDAIKAAVVKALEHGTLRTAYDEILDAIGDEVRADLIARTEVMRAANAGQREAWHQAVDKGFLSGRARRVWIYTPDGLACPLCESLDGKTAPLNGQYPDEGGDGPPLHPRCRCTESVIS